jgi:hypothetical protein
MIMQLLFGWFVMSVATTAGWIAWARFSPEKFFPGRCES